MSNTVVTLTHYEYCQMCAKGDVVATASYDAKLSVGQWAYVCQKHYEQFGVGLGLGLGQKIEYILNPTIRDNNIEVRDYGYNRPGN